MKNGKPVVTQAMALAQSAETWADLANALFDPRVGLLTKAYPNPKARRAFQRTSEYKKICSLLGKSMDTTGLVKGATPKKSGRFVVRLPQSLHAALEREAHSEGVSLNQLVVAKLAVQFSDSLTRMQGVK